MFCIRELGRAQTRGGMENRGHLPPRSPRRQHTRDFWASVYKPILLPNIS